MFQRAFPYLSIDIETRNLTADEVEFEGQFVKAHPGTKDKEKIEAQIEKKKQNLLEKGALTNTCEIASIAIHVPGEMPIVIHTFDFNEDLTEEFFIDHMPCTNEKEMMNTFFEIVSSACDDETELVVANRDFDFPKLRMKALVNRVPIPQPFMPGAHNRIYDVLFMASKYFMIGGQYNISLDELCKRLGVGTGEKAIPGSEVPGMVERGEYKEVIVYNGLDALKNSECYELMTGRY